MCVYVCGEEFVVVTACTYHIILYYFSFSFLFFGSAFLRFVVCARLLDVDDNNDETNGTVFIYIYVRGRHDP